jgi:hypothetical protein
MFGLAEFAMILFLFFFLLILCFSLSFLLSLAEAVSPVLAIVDAALLGVLAPAVFLYFDVFKFW